MAKRPLKVGICGALNAARTPHARTFLRAISAAMNCLHGSEHVSVVFADDAAVPGQAVSVAKVLVKQGVDVVVGPFASDCFSAAAAIFAAATVPLVLPAATIRLPQYQGSAFHICPSDALIASQIAERVVSRGFSKVTLEADKSQHSSRLRETISRNLARSQIRIVDAASADAAIYAGRLAASRTWLRGLRASGHSIPALLTDDAAAEELLHGLPCPGDIEVFGFPTAHNVPEAIGWATRYQWQYQSPAPIYFLEVLAAMAIVLQAAQSQRPLVQSLSEETFFTPLGPVRFEHGERQSATCAIWRPGPDGILGPQEIITLPEQGIDDDRAVVTRRA
jgi:ABC-type branched-subunit amino acid transport system substrate-binding protein